jgi:hypothetical protein
MIVIRRKFDKEYISNWLRSYELDCKCDDLQCKTTMTTVGMLEAYDKLCDIYGVKIVVDSCYKCTNQRHADMASSTCSSSFGSSMLLVCPPDTKYGDFLIVCRRVFHTVTEMNPKHVCLCDIGKR